MIRLERRGLRRLHALARTGACQETPGTSAPAPSGTGSASPPGIAPGASGLDLTLVFAGPAMLAFVLVVTREVKRTD